MRKATGYFFIGSKSAGFTIQPYTLSPPAPMNVN